MKQYRDEAAASQRARMGRMGVGHADGGGAHSDEAEDRKLIKRMLKEHDRKPKKDGGAVEGDAPKRRMDRFAAGGRTKGKGTVNVVVTVPPSQPAAPPMPMAATAAPAPAPRPAPMMPPMGGAPQGMPMPPAPLARKSGGRTPSKEEEDYGGRTNYRGFKKWNNDPDLAWAREKSHAHDYGFEKTVEGYKKKPEHDRLFESGFLDDMGAAMKRKFNAKNIPQDPTKVRMDRQRQMNKGQEAADKRARGGRLGMDAGALSGEGRLEKTAIQRRERKGAK